MIINTFHLLLRSHGKQLIYGNAEIYGNLRQHLHVRYAVAAFPLADGLRAHIQSCCQGFLRKAPVIPQAADFFSHFHNDDLLISCSNHNHNEHEKPAIVMQVNSRDS